MSDLSEFIDKPTEELKALKKSLADELAGAQLELKEIQGELSRLSVDLNLAKSRQSAATSDQAYQAATEKIGELGPKVQVRQNRIILLQEQIAGIQRRQQLVSFELTRQEIHQGKFQAAQEYNELKKAHKAYTILAKQFHDSWLRNSANIKQLESMAGRLGISNYDLYVPDGPYGISTNYAQFLADVALDGLK
jgi:predicted  nucleic acid-binding Zn-ribbon protein